jgi:hypothetical protein
MENLTVEKQNRIHAVMRAIQKVTVKQYLCEVMNAADIAGGEPHNFEALVAAVTAKCVENGCNFPEAFVSEMIQEIVAEIPTPVSTPDPLRESPPPPEVCRGETLEYDAAP